MRITLRYILPLIFFIGLVILLGQSLFIRSQEQPAKEEKKEPENSSLRQISSAILNLFNASNAPTEKNRRAFSLKSLTNPSKELTQDMFKGKVTILNVWASWCGACRVGQETLLALSKLPKQSKSIFWVGLNINDHVDEAQRMLQIYGNPYQEIIYDPEGCLAIHLGIRGTPALLILDKKGGIQYRHYGPINSLTWEEEILPLIKNLEES